MQGFCISNCCLDILVGKILERIDVFNHIVENLMEDIVDPCTTDQLSMNVVNVVTLKSLGIAFQEIINDGDYVSRFISNLLKIRLLQIS